MSLRYRVSPDVQTYLRAARGFRAPSIQERLLFGDAVTVADTETILSFEGGTKLRLWGRRLHLNMAAFQYFMQDQQLTAVGGETNFNRLVNADSTIGRGIEAELTFLPITTLEISAGLVTIRRALTTQIWQSRDAVLRVQCWIRKLLLPELFPSTATVCRRLRVGLRMYPCATCSRFPEVHA